MLEILVASTNESKIYEFKKLVTGLNIKIYSLNDFNIHIDINENGKTFTDNALIKVNEIYKIKKDILIISDDSGIIIDELPGILGIHTARYMSDVPYIERCSSILKKLGNSTHRSARYVCSIALMENGKVKVFERKCEGKISFKYINGNGFGYDPIFIPEGYETTFSQMSEEMKNEMSHRGLAFKDLVEYLRSEYNEYLIK